MKGVGAMARTEGARLVLNNQEMAEFLQQVNHPDEETVRRRNHFFAELDQIELVEHEDGSFEFEFELSSTEETAMQSTLGTMESKIKSIDDNLYVQSLVSIELPLIAA